MARALALLALTSAVSATVFYEEKFEDGAQAALSLAGWRGWRWPA